MFSNSKRMKSTVFRVKMAEKTSFLIQHVFHEQVMTISGRSGMRMEEWLASKYAYSTKGKSGLLK